MLEGRGGVTVQAGDTLKSLSRRIYGNEAYWYVLADANGLEESSPLVAGSTLTVPEVRTSLNDANTFKPYNPAEVTGPTTPSLPYIPPAAAACDPIATIVMAVVAIVVAPYATGLLLPGTAGGVSATFATGLKVLAGNAGLSLGATAGLAAAGGFAGSVASQAVGKAAGWVDHFSLRDAVAAGIGAGVTAGLAGRLGGSTAELLAGKAGPARIAGSAVGNAVGRYVGGKIAGLDTSFSWRAIAADAVSSVLTARANQSLGFNAEQSVGGTGQIGQDVVGELVGGVVSLHTRRAAGFDDPVNYGQIAADAFGNAIGNEVVRGMTGGSKPTPSAEQRADWDRLLRDEGRITLAGPGAPLSGGVVAVSYAVDDPWFDPNYRPSVELLPDEVQAAGARISSTEARSQAIDAAHASRILYWDEYRGTVGGDLLANGMTLAANTYRNFAQTANSLEGLAFDRQYGDEFKANAAWAIRNPGQVADAIGDGLESWWDSPWEDKLQSAGTLGFETVLTGGFSLVGRVDDAVALTRVSPKFGSSNQLIGEAVANKETVYFGQRRIDPKFSDDPRFPHTSGKSIDEVVANLRDPSHPLTPDDLPITAFRDPETGLLVSQNTRTRAALAKAGLEPTKVEIVDLNSLPKRERLKYLQRLTEEPILKGNTLPSKVVPVTPNRGNPTILDIIEIW